MMGENTEIEQAADTELDRLRSEVEELRGALARAQGELEQQAEQEPQGWRRRWMSIACAIVAALLLPASVLTVWARNTMLDTDEYVATVAPLATDENIQEAVAFRVTESIAEAADFRSIAEDALPPDAQVLAGPIEAGAKTVIGEGVAVVLATDEFAQLWGEANRVAHQSVLPLLEGRDDGAVTTAEGRVSLQLGTVAASAVGLVDERLGTELATQIPEEELDAEVVLIDSDELADAQTVVGWIDGLSWFTPILAVALLVGAIMFAEDRRLGVRRFGLAVALPMLLTLLGYAWARSVYVDGLDADVHNPAAATAVFDILTRFFARLLRALLVLGVVALIGAWAVGPSSSAIKLRAWWDTLLGRAGDSAADREVGAVPQFVAANERGFLIGAAVLGGLTLVLWTRPTGLVVLLIAIVTLLVIGGVRMLAAVGRRAETDSTAPGSADVSADPSPEVDLRQPTAEAAEAADAEPVDAVADS